MPQHQSQTWIERIPRRIKQIIALKGGKEYLEGREHVHASRTVPHIYEYQAQQRLNTKNDPKFSRYTFHKQVLHIPRGDAVLA